MNPVLKRPGALPFLAVVFLNAFVDLGHKITIQNTLFRVYDGPTQVILTAIVNALILLPFILLFSPAGFIGSRYPKNRVMRYAAWAAVFITLAITVCYYLGQFWLAFIMTLLLAIQSAIYSPAKYGYIKVLFGKDHLAEGNGIVQAVTIVAILLGTFAFSITFELFTPGLGDKSSILQALAPVGWLLVANSILEVFLAYRLPQLEQGNVEERFVPRDYLSGRLMRHNLHELVSNSVIRLSVIGIALFWSVGQVMLAAFPAFAKDHLGVGNTVVIQGVLAASGLGIATGSYLAARWSRNYIETGLIPVGALGIAVGLAILPSLNSPTACFIDFMFVGVMGGLFIVPLNALIQFHTPQQELARILAGSNFVQNISMLLFLCITVGFALAGLGTTGLLVMIALVALVGCFYTILKLPQSLVHFLLASVMKQHYRVHVHGLNNLPGHGGVLLLGNHISWIDWAIIQIASPRPVRFVMIKSIYRLWYLKWFFRLFKTIPIEPGAGSQRSLDSVAELLNNGEVVCLFPEGAISKDGELAELKPGYMRACERVSDSVVIVPFYLHGLWGSKFSYAQEPVKLNLSEGLGRDVIVAFGQPLPKSLSVDGLRPVLENMARTDWDS